jgi:hypothetical protein
MSNDNPRLVPQPVVTAVTSILIPEFLAHFGPPRSDDVGLFLDGFKRALGEFTDREIRTVTDYYLQTATTRTWPLLGQVRTRCEDERDMGRPREFPDNATSLAIKSHQRAQQLMFGDLGVQAATEGWATELFEHLRAYGQHPDAATISQLRRRADAWEAVNAHLPRATRETMRRARDHRADKILAWAESQDAPQQLTSGAAA